MTESYIKRFRQMSDDELANIDPRSLSPAERHDRLIEINRRARQRARHGAKQDQKRWWMKVLMIAATLAAVAAVLVIYALVYTSLRGVRLSLGIPGSGFL